LFFLRNDQEGEQKEKNTCRPFLKPYARSIYPPTFRQNGATAPERALSKKDFGQGPTRADFYASACRLNAKMPRFVKLQRRGVVHHLLNTKGPGLLFCLGPPWASSRAPRAWAWARPKSKKRWISANFARIGLKPLQAMISSLIPQERSWVAKLETTSFGGKPRGFTFLDPRNCGSEGLLSSKTHATTPKLEHGFSRLGAIRICKQLRKRSFFASAAFRQSWEILATFPSEGFAFAFRAPCSRGPQNYDCMSKYAAWFKRSKTAKNSSVSFLVRKRHPKNHRFGTGAIGSKNLYPSPTICCFFYI